MHKKLGEGRVIDCKGEHFEVEFEPRTAKFNAGALLKGIIKLTDADDNQVVIDNQNLSNRIQELENRNTNLLDKIEML